jgi:hypothetical protein
MHLRCAPRDAPPVSQALAHASSQQGFVWEVLLEHTASFAGVMPVGAQPAPSLHTAAALTRGRRARQGAWRRGPRCRTVAQGGNYRRRQQRCALRATRACAFGSVPRHRHWPGDCTAICAGGICADADCARRRNAGRRGRGERRPAPAACFKQKTFLLQECRALSGQPARAAALDVANTDALEAAIHDTGVQRAAMADC